MQDPIDDTPFVSIDQLEARHLEDNVTTVETVCSILHGSLSFPMVSFNVDVKTMVVLISII